MFIHALPIKTVTSKASDSLICVSFDIKSDQDVFYVIPLLTVFRMNSTNFDDTSTSQHQPSYQELNASKIDPGDSIKVDQMLFTFLSKDLVFSIIRRKKTYFVDIRRKKQVRWSRSYYITTNNGITMKLGDFKKLKESVYKFYSGDSIGEF